MITAEEQLNRTKICVLKADSFNSNFYEEKDVLQAMIEFAKLHVTEALKQASEKARVEVIPVLKVYNINREEILEAYSLDNIK